MLEIEFNRGVVLKALKVAMQVATEKNKEPGSTWDALLIKKQIEFLEGDFPSAHRMHNYIGGLWLGQARDWIKQKAINGSDVIWGSDTPLRFRSPLSPSDIERIAAYAASAACAEVLGMKQTTDFL